MKNENKTDEMVDILSFLHQCVPMQSEKKMVRVPKTDKIDEIQVESSLHSGGWRPTNLKAN